MQTVDPAVTATTLSASTLIWTLDVPIVFTAKVIAASGGVPAGTVTFTMNGTQTFTVTLVSGVATLHFAGFTGEGLNTVSAAFNPASTNFAASNSDTSNTSLDRDVLLASAVSVTATPNPVPVGQPVTLSTVVTGSAGPPTGTVSFYSGKTLLGTVTLDPTGSASLDIALALGTHDITVVYSGDGTYNPSTSKAVAVVVRTLVALR